MTSHIVITGTGRAGTTFLVQLFSCLGFKTALDSDYKYCEVSKAGLENDIRLKECQDLEVIKDPKFCDYVEEVIENDIPIRHIYIPIRELDQACKSRERIQKTGIAYGCFWDANNIEEQELSLLNKFYKLLLSVSATNIPVTFIKFPKLVDSPFYLHEKLKPVISHITLEKFLLCFNQVSHPNWVHKF